MSCSATSPTFRLLDSYVGWEPQPIDGTKHLIGLDDPDGLMLDLENPGVVDASAILRYLPPPRLARGCEPCEWYLVTTKPSRLLHLNRCASHWVPVWDRACNPALLGDAVTIAVRGHKIAIADQQTDRILIWTGNGVRLDTVIELTAPGPIAFFSNGEMIAASENGRHLVWFDREGLPKNESVFQLPGNKSTVVRLAVSDHDIVWLVTRENKGEYRLWKTAGKEKVFQPATVDQLVLDFPPSELTAAVEDIGFCLSHEGYDGTHSERCFSWRGHPINHAELPVIPPPKRHAQGQLLTGPIDSGIPRCRWHRVRLEAQTPLGTKLEIAVSTSEEKAPVGQGVNDVLWTEFPAGLPHPSDWQTATSWDFLIDQPPGRYLFLRVRFTGNHIVTPRVRRVRLDFPRETSLENLPPIYRDNPEAEDFTERFLSLFDASIEDLDRAIERYPALLDPAGIPQEVLPWLSSFLDLTLDPSWDTSRCRNILQALPDLYRKRGTLNGIKQACLLVFGIEPVIRELSKERPWGALRTSSATLGQIRLFGKSKARVRLGSSFLGRAQIKSYGNPDHDPLNIGAYRLQVLAPPVSGLPLDWKDQFKRLVENQKPAHTIVDFGFAGDGFILGQRVALGVDTAFVSPATPVLGQQGNVRLSRGSVLWAGARGKAGGIVVGENIQVGIQTIVE